MAAFPSIDAPSIRRLRAAVTVAERKSFSAASHRLSLSQPALTKCIAGLEADLQAKLFVRTTAGSSLTQDGEKYIARAMRFFDQLRAALSAVGGDPVERRLQKLTGVHTRNLIMIWRLQSFRAAARALGVSEPSLQRPARDLEQIVGARLYRKLAGGLGVNQTGAELARRFAVAYEELRAGAEEIGRISRERPSLRIGVLALAPRAELSAAIEETLRANASQRISVMEAEYSRCAELLRAGELDVFFGALRSSDEARDVVEEPFFEDPYVLVCRRRHPLAGRADIRPDDLRAFDWIHPTAGIPRRNVLDRHLAAWGARSDVQFETSCLSTISALLACSDRLTILARSNIVGGGPLDVIERIPLAHESRRVGLTYRRDWLPTPFQEAFLRRLRMGQKRGQSHRRTA